MDAFKRRGASVIPFCRHQDDALFLFHKTFSGRRAGKLVDFGGGAEPGESHRDTAIREFIEETETLYFAEDIETAVATPERVAAQRQILEALFERSLGAHPEWHCRRSGHPESRTKDWLTFFIAVDYRHLDPLNDAWARDKGARFRKRRELLWVASEELLRISATTPDRLWKRLRQLENLADVVRSISRQTG